MEKNLENRKIVAAQQYALDNCKDNFSSLTKVKVAYEAGFDASNEIFKFTLEDMQKCFESAREQDHCEILDDDFYDRYKTFDDYVNYILA